MKTFCARLVVLASIIFCATSCGKKNDPQKDTSKTTPSTPSQLLTVNKIAKLWKNGVVTMLTDGSKNAAANAVYVSGGNVYVAGYESNGTNAVAKLWKNGIASALSDGTSNAEANSIFVSGNDVYIAGLQWAPGYVSKKAVLWKNGVLTSLTDYSANSIANSVYVLNNDTYAVGYEAYDVTNTGAMVIQVAVLWKNGVATILSTIPSAAASVYVSGSDVYVAGFEANDRGGSIAKVWKNGSSLPILDKGFGSIANSVYVSGSDVYVAGLEAQNPTIGYPRLSTVWKNNAPTAFTDDPNDAGANSVYVSGNDVYIAGFQYSGTKTTVNGNVTINEIGRNIARIWKNGVATSLTDGTKEASANSIFVVGNDVYVAGFESVSQ